MVVTNKTPNIEINDFDLMSLTFKIATFVTFLVAQHGLAQDTNSAQAYKKRVLESAEIDLLSSYYSQDGNNAAVSGGIGDENLTDATGALVISIPLNDDDILTIDGGVSAYTSASSSNVNPFDGSRPADAFVASSGASQSDVWANFVIGYNHSSENRNDLWSAKASVASEYDYFSIGIGGSYSKLFNQKNTEIGLSGNVYFDSWNAIYPFELRPFGINGDGLNDPFFSVNNIIGNADYSPTFNEFNRKGRNSYSLGLSLSQILSKYIQGTLVLDFIKQDGLLSTPFQRVYFADKEDSFIENFHLADAIEQLPKTRFKTALGGRLHFFLNETFVLRTYYRYYFDDWGIKSHTASFEIPVKISDKFTLYPSYRFYNQSSADYFAPYEEHLSSEIFYTSDYDLSKYKADQFGLGVTYTDIFSSFHISKFGMKNIDLKYNYYKRDTGLSSGIVSLGIKFIMD